MSLPGLENKKVFLKKQFKTTCPKKSRTPLKSGGEKLLFNLTGKPYHYATWF